MNDDKRENAALSAAENAAGLLGAGSLDGERAVDRIIDDAFRAGAEALQTDEGKALLLDRHEGRVTRAEFRDRLVALVARMESQKPPTT